MIHTDLQQPTVNFEEFCPKCEHYSKLEKKEYPCYVCRGGYPYFTKREIPFKFKPVKNS